MYPYVLFCYYTQWSTILILHVLNLLEWKSCLQYRFSFSLFEYLGVFSMAHHRTEWVPVPLYCYNSVPIQ